MYKHQNKTYLGKSKHFVQWVNRKIILIITAVMIGMSNAMYDDDKMINGNQNHTEQQDKKD